jgi:Zn-dependent protease with chaperone function
MMHDVSLFFAQCAHSRAVLDSLCALVLIPPGAWIAARLLAPQIFRMGDDPAWQAPYTAAAASLPGALFFALAVFALVHGIGTACWSMPGGRFIFSAITLLAIAAILRAVWLAMARDRDLRQLVRSSRPPSNRLRELTAIAGLRAREIYDDAPVCALAGVLAPVVLVSSGALRSLDDEQLRAALLHERAHVVRGDQLIALCLSFFADLLPLPAIDFIDAYKLARELAADRSAVQTASDEALAGALVAFAKSGRALAGATSFSGPARSNVASRISAMLDDRRESYSSSVMVRRLVLGLALLIIVAAGITAPVSAAQRPASCSIHASSNP